MAAVECLQIHIFEENLQTNTNLNERAKKLFCGIERYVELSRIISSKIKDNKIDQNKPVKIIFYIEFI